MGTVELTNLRCEAGGSCFLVDAAALDEERARIGRVLDAAGADSVLQPYLLLDGLGVGGVRVTSTVETDIVVVFATEDGRRLQRPEPMRMRATPTLSGAIGGISGEVRADQTICASETLCERDAIRRLRPWIEFTCEVLRDRCNDLFARQIGEALFQCRALLVSL